MSTPPPRGNPPPDGFHASPDEVTLADQDEWRIPAQYDVEGGEPATPEETVVLRDPGDVARGPRRFPPDLNPALLATLIGVLLLLVLIPGGVWLTTRDDDEATAAGPETTLETPTQPTTTETAPTSLPGTPTVPDVTGLGLAEARALLAGEGFVVRFRREASDQPRDQVLGQDPRADAEADAGSVVVLAVSEGVERVAVPDVGGASARDAVATLREAGLRSRTQLVASEERAGTVVGQSPGAGEEVESNALVILDVAREQPVSLVQVPDLVGTTSSEARSQLRSVGLRSTQRPVESSRPAGTVVGQSPPAGTDLREGGVVTLRVSTGPPSLAVPDVVGLDQADAVRELRQAGFTALVVDEPTADEAEDGTVLGQSPVAGTTRRKGSTVTITVARFT